MSFGNGLQRGGPSREEGGSQKSNLTPIEKPTSQYDREVSEEGGLTKGRPFRGSNWATSETSIPEQGRSGLLGREGSEAGCKSLPATAGREEVSRLLQRGHRPDHYGAGQRLNRKMGKTRNANITSGGPDSHGPARVHMSEWGPMKKVV